MKMADVPKPTIGYVVVNPGWDPVREPAAGWLLRTLKDAKLQQQAFAAMVPGKPRKLILKAVTTYTLVEDGGEIP